MSWRATPVDRKDKSTIQKSALGNMHVHAVRVCSIRDAFFVASTGFILLLILVSGCRQSQPPQRSQGRKLVVLGFDGADPDLLQKWMSEGQLPHIQQLI